MPSDSVIADPRRRPKGDKRVRTREALLDAARDVTREKGLDQTTLQDVADRAGMTTGAIYGNFKNRDDLFMALAERQWPTIRPRFAPGSSFAEKMRALSEAVLASIPEREPAAIGALRFRAYVLGHEEVRRQFRDTMAAGFDAGADWFRAAVAEEDLPMPPELLVRVINAMIEGLTFQRFLTPELMPDEVFHQAFAALAGGRAQRRRSEKRPI
jgi:AcrR family transcriptional regulator